MASSLSDERENAEPGSSSELPIAALPDTSRSATADRLGERQSDELLHGWLQRLTAEDARVDASSPQDYTQPAPETVNQGVEDTLLDLAERMWYNVLRDDAFDSEPSGWSLVASHVSLDAERSQDEQLVQHECEEEEQRTEDPEISFPPEPFLPLVSAESSDAQEEGHASGLGRALESLASSAILQQAPPRIVQLPWEQSWLGGIFGESEAVLPLCALHPEITASEGPDAKAAVATNVLATATNASAQLVLGRRAPSSKGASMEARTCHMNRLMSQ